TVEPFDRGGARGMRIPPGEAQISGQCFDRMIPGRPFSRFQNYIPVEINRSCRVEQSLYILRCADVRILLLELSIDRSLVLGVVVNAGTCSRGKIIKRCSERIALGFGRRLVCKE